MSKTYLLPIPGYLTHSIPQRTVLSPPLNFLYLLQKIILIIQTCFLLLPSHQTFPNNLLNLSPRLSTYLTPYPYSSHLNSYIPLPYPLSKFFSTSSSSILPDPLPLLQATAHFFPHSPSLTFETVVFSCFTLAVAGAPDTLQQRARGAAGLRAPDLDLRPRRRHPQRTSQRGIVLILRPTLDPCLVIVFTNFFQQRGLRLKSSSSSLLNSLVEDLSNQEEKSK